MSWSDIDWGNAPSWGALTAGVTAAAFTGRNVLVDRHDRRTEQARKVAAWWGQQDESSSSIFASPRSSGAWLVNTSDVPVYDVVVTWKQPGGVLETRKRRLVPPGEEFVYILQKYNSGDVEAERRYERVLNAIAEVEDGFPVRLEFTDAAGRRWQRTEHGALKQIRQPKRSRDES